jgi:hypothetical protein
MQLLDVANELPAEFEVLRAEARAEGYRHLDRLADEWGSGAARFNREGEKLVAAVLDGELAGIGGLTLDPEQPGAPFLRQQGLPQDRNRVRLGREFAGPCTRVAAAADAERGCRQRAVLAFSGFRPRCPQWPHPCLSLTIWDRPVIAESAL